MKKQKKEAGFIVSAELVLIATIVVIGMVVGLAIIRDAMTAEMNDVAEAIGAIDQSYAFAGITALNSASQTLVIISGSGWEDSTDGLAGDEMNPVYISPGPDNTEGANFF